MDRSTLMHGSGSLSADPSTPPYTPLSSKQPFGRSESPGSIKSLQPTETISPTKAAERRPVHDTIEIEELTEADAGYVAELDIVYPEGLEEAESEINTDADSSDNDGSDVDISAPFSRLECEDSEDLTFEKKRRAKHARKRADSKTFKRTHSTSVESDTEMNDPDTFGDQDRSSSARRLRRRTGGPNGVQVVYDDAVDGPPVSGAQCFTTGSRDQNSLVGGDDSDSTSNDGMELDEMK